MNLLQACKVVQAIAPVAIKDNAAWTAAAIDTLGFRHCDIVVQLGVTDIAMAGLKLQESADDGAADAYADVPGGIFGTSTNSEDVASTVPSATDDGLLFGFSVALRKRKRYLKLVATAGDGSAGTFSSALAILQKSEEGPVTAAQRGFDEQLIIT